MSKTYININGDIREASSLELPSTGRKFRKAWQFNGPVVDIDLDQAKEIKREEIRREREPELQRLDVEYFKAMEQGEDVKPIVDQKRKLRDATQHDAITNAKTADELAKITLDDLIK